jgi:tRNA/tmRNA/rRNA uracil-C5-methylase (TrmA/RlmC/RlmD family)
VKTWDHYGKNDPYYGVLSAEEYRKGRMDAQARARVFELGERQVDQFVALARNAFGFADFDTALDYGCGVGRLSRALSSRFRSVIAVDISQGMLEEARRNLEDRSNVTFEHVDSMSDDKVDFLMSKIVFQHIPPEQGLAILGRQAQRLSERGAGVIDFPVIDRSGLLRRFLRALRKYSPFGEPVIPMYVYDLNRIEQTLRAAGMGRIHVTRTPTPPFEKAIVAFAR